jgi:hypothetical protein
MITGNQLCCNYLYHYYSYSYYCILYSVCLLQVELTVLNISVCPVEPSVLSRAISVKQLDVIIMKMEGLPEIIIELSPPPGGSQPGGIHLI